MSRSKVAWLAASAVAATVTLSAAPAANANVGCYQPQGNRLLRIIPEAQKCGHGERRIEWGAGSSDSGSAGKKGARGAKGDKGDTGAAGAAGAKGEAGAAGAAGAKGDKGETGAGAQGATGAQGVAGATGATGATGAAGLQGATGATGLQGVQGEVGAPGATGATGAQGDQGNTGAAGLEGVAGATGATGATGADGAQGATGPVGPQGEQGATGATGADGATGASGATGATGSAGAGAILSSNSATPAVATTIVGGLVGTVSVLPLSGVGNANGVGPTGATIELGTPSTPGQNVTGQPIPRDGTITSLSGFQSTTVAQSLVGTTLTTQVQLWRANDDSNSYSPVPGAVTTLAPSLTGVVAIGTTSSGITTGLSIPVTAGSKYVVVYSATATGLALANTVTANVGASVSIS